MTAPLRVTQPGESAPDRDLSARVLTVDMLATGATYRQLDWWARTGLLGAHHSGRGHGNVRRWTERDRRVVAVMARLTRSGFGIWPEAAAEMAHRYVDTGERRIVRGSVALTWELVEEGAE